MNSTSVKGNTKFLEKFGQHLFEVNDEGYSIVTNRKFINETQYESKKNIESSLSKFQAIIKSELLNQNGFKSYFTKSHVWVGTVIEIEDNKFLARLEDIQSQEELFSEFETYNISNDDFNLFKLGAQFYYIVGDETVNGQKKTGYLLRFKRGGVINAESFDSAFEKMKQLQELTFD